MTAKRLNYPLGPFVKGMDNRRPDISLEGTEGDEGDRVQSAVNIDVTLSGTLKRRKGYAKVYTGDCHSLWAEEGNAFMVRGTDLVRISGPAEAPVLTVLRSGMAPGATLSYAATPRGVFWSDGQVLRRIEGNVVRAATVPAPPAGSASASGPARYAACFTYSDEHGEEGPASTPLHFGGPVTGLITLTGLPATFPSGAVQLNVYLTHPNDTILQRHSIRSDPSTTVEVLGGAVDGAECRTLELQAMPAGQIVRHHGARLLVAARNVLHYSEPFMLGLRNPGRGFVQYPADITVVEPTSGGLWVCADQTYWYPGLDIAAATQEAVLPYGGVLGSGSKVPNSNSVFWMSPRGVVVGTQSGEAQNVQEGRTAVEPAGYGAALFREEDGMKQIVESVFAPGINRMAATSYMSAELIRRSDL